MRSGWILIWILFAYTWDRHACWYEGPSCIQVKPPRSQCDILNISSRVVQQPPYPPMEFDLLMLQIDHISMLYPDGEITRMLSKITRRVVYEVYHANILRIPADSQLIVISLKSAPELQTIKVSGINNVLQSLEVDKSAIRRIPTSVKQLKRLKYLAIRNSIVDTLSVQPLQGIRRLTEVYLEHNKLRRLEVNTDPKKIMPIERLLLSYNLLEFIDMKFFTPFKRLRELELHHNRLKQIIANRPVALSLLHTLQLARNELMQLNLSNWIMPKLGALYLQNNNLTQLPIGIGRFPELKTIFLNDNQLTVLDLLQLVDLRKLSSLQIARNRLHTILPNCQPSQKTPCRRVLLPILKEIHLNNNYLTDIDFNLWDMPALVHLTLHHNRLKRLRNIYQKFPNLNRLYAWNNSISCSDIRSMKTYLEMQIASIGLKAKSSACSTNSFFPHPTEPGVICCND